MQPVQRHGEAPRRLGRVEHPPARGIDPGVQAARPPAGARWPGQAADRHHRIARLLRQAELGERGAAGEGRLGCDSVDLRRPLGPSRDRIAGGLQGPVEAVMPHEQGARDAERRQDAQQAHADPEVRLEPEAAKAGGERARHADILAKLPSR